MLKVMIHETGQIKTLSLTTPQTGFCYVKYFIQLHGGFNGDFQTIKHDKAQYTINKDRFNYWQSCIDSEQSINARLWYFEQKYGAKAIMDLLSKNNAKQYNDLPSRQNALSEAISNQFNQ